MSRGRGFSSPRGSGYRGSSSRGSSSWGGGGRGGYSHGSGSSGRFSSFSNSLDSRSSFDSRNKYSGSSDRFSRPHSDDYHKPYRPDSSYSSGRDSSGSRRSPDRKRLRIEVSTIARKIPKRSSDKEDSGDEKPKETRSNDAENVEDKDTPEIKKEKDTSGGIESGDEKARRKAFIKLNCPHCGIKAITFRKYEMHLSSRPHLIAMRKIALKQKSILAQMRQAQRNTQNELEKNSDDLTSKTNFCPLCKLNYKQKRLVHQASEAHKNMKKFLMPYCKVCNTTFKSPMIYESHCCSIEHIKRKQRMDSGSSDVSAEEDSLENFTTIDSVGDGEEVMRAMHQKILSKHCKLRVHMQRYVRYKEDQDLEKRAEKLQRKEMAEKEVHVKKEKPDQDTSEISISEAVKDGKDSESKCVDDEEARDDKLWADVDKDLGDILAEAESGNKSSDEDEDSHVNGERYDRFKLSEKNDEDDIKNSGDEGNKTNKEAKEVNKEKK
ncbi:hypothetical protein NQ315_000006 [Exocentrus adspersus]|uniref:Zinc finger protein on ecdysone puffs n=1 Tax=Exocentrus adspersus TaxID=1586481 RepID=A0AAV8VGA8_9CUCU|nr:hypothetical protein NQ315_000006 [Exocentrus adspersus]